MTAADRVILDLCGGSAAWSKPYSDAGYDVRLIDIENGQDVRLLEYSEKAVHGVLAAPPCTHLAGSGARWWDEKGDGALLEALSVVDACLRVVVVHRPKWWVLENPVGRLTRFLGPPRMYFDPWWFGDGWTKKTALWGEFNVPRLKPIEPIKDVPKGSHCQDVAYSKLLAEGKNPIHHMPPSPERSKLRSITPEGFARAFFEVNP